MNLYTPIHHLFKKVDAVLQGLNPEELLFIGGVLIVLLMTSWIEII